MARAAAAQAAALGGLVIAASGYRLLWILGGVSLAAGSVVAIVLRRRMVAHRAATSTGRMSAMPPTSR